MPTVMNFVIAARLSTLNIRINKGTHSTVICRFWFLHGEKEGNIFSQILMSKLDPVTLPLGCTLATMHYLLHIDHMQLTSIPHITKCETDRSQLDLILTEVNNLHASLIQ